MLRLDLRRLLRSERVVRPAVFLQPRVLGTRAVALLHELHIGCEGDVGETVSHGVILGRGTRGDEQIMIPAIWEINSSLGNLLLQ